MSYTEDGFPRIVQSGIDYSFIIEHTRNDSSTRQKVLRANTRMLRRLTVLSVYEVAREPVPVPNAEDLECR